jgi:isopropylmalate/homocitrate/citramalate synthase
VDARVRVDRVRLPQTGGRTAAVARVAGGSSSWGATISIGDTIGVAGPDQVPQVVAAVAERVPLDRIALHLHDTGGRALDNVAAGLEVGVRTFDSSAAGLGGCPFAPGAPGNVATEALVRFLHRQGMETGVDPDAVERAGRGVRDRLAA